jgi:hypothetical protein
VSVSEASRGLFALNGFNDPERGADHALASAGVMVDVFGLEPVDSPDHVSVSYSTKNVGSP